MGCVNWMPCALRPCWWSYYYERVFKELAAMPQQKD